MTSTSDIKRYRANLYDEFNSAIIYQQLSEMEKDPKLAEIYRRLAETEQTHADVWVNKLKDAGANVPSLKPSWRTRTLLWLATRFGVEAVLPSLSSTEDIGTRKYASQSEAAEMIPSEQSHARLLRQISRTVPGGMTGGTLARLEGRHRSAGGNALRAAVLGASDGLLSNFNLIMGVAGAQLATGTILLTGIAGLLAGAISMALGEWISVQSSRELYQKQIKTEQEEIISAPEEETEELSLIYQARGLDEPSAKRLAIQIMSTKEGALETLAREELGIDTQELGGSAWVAAITSFLLFAAGAVVPIIPFTFLKETIAIAISAGLSAVALFGIGAAITLYTGRAAWKSGLRQVAFGLAAAAATFIIGRLIGTSLAG